MLAEVIKTLEVPARFWAELVGCSSSQMSEWLSGQRDLPESVAERLSRAIGIPASTFLGKRVPAAPMQSLLPPLWLKARNQGLGVPEHRAIAIARLLASRFEEVLSLVEEVRTVAYRTTFEEVRKAVDPQAPAEAQGETAAAAFLRFSTLDKGGVGIGEVFRGYLRALGVLILETPVESAKLEGFCLPVGTPPNVRPCLLANAFKTTWFRRNYVLLHELAHAIFDLDGTTAVFDELPGDGSASGLADIAECRADAFAMHTLVSRKMLAAFEGKHGAIRTLGKVGLARLVAQTHGELRLVLRAARRYNLLTEEAALGLAATDIAEELRKQSSHAKLLPHLTKDEVWNPDLISVRVRTTTFPLAGIRLPIPFVRLVLDALVAEQIVPRKAAELLMITTEELTERFPQLVPPGLEPA